MSKSKSPDAKVDPEELRKKQMAETETVSKKYLLSFLLWSKMIKKTEIRFVFVSPSLMCRREFRSQNFP